MWFDECSPNVQRAFSPQTYLSPVTLSNYLLRGGSVLRPGSETVERADVHITDSTISWIGAPGDGPEAAESIDVNGAWILPGIVDLHGDAFERSLMPRPGVWMDLAIALDDNDQQLLASGITTGYLSATDSWEPGLRSRETLRLLVAALASRDGGPDVLLHVRHECCHVEGHEELLQWVVEGAVRLLSFNDHTPGGIPGHDSLSVGQVQRSGVARAELEKLQDIAVSSRQLGRSQEDEIASAAKDVSCPLAAHDPSSLEHLSRDIDLGVSIAEFPMQIELGGAYEAAGIPVLLGAPNLVRGGSHLGNLSVADALRGGIGSIICSDYHYPSLLQAPFVAAARDILPFGKAWSLVSANPAAAAGLDDRGELALGKRADLAVVEPPTDTTPARAKRVFVAGKPLLTTV